MVHTDQPAYDDIAAQYEEYARTATFKQAERHTFLALVGSPALFDHEATSISVR